MKRIAPTLIDSERILFSICNGCRYRRSLRKLRLPLAIEINKCGEIRLPRLNIKWIAVVHHVTFIEIFVRETSETVAELMDYDRTEILVAGGGEGIAVVDAATAIFLRVCLLYTSPSPRD